MDEIDRDREFHGARDGEYRCECGGRSYIKIVRGPYLCKRCWQARVGIAENSLVGGRQGVNDGKKVGN